MTVAKPVLKPGVRHSPYMGRWRFENQPDVFDPSEDAAETSQRLADSAYFTEYADLWPGCPSRIEKMEWALTFHEVMNQDDLLHLDMLRSAAYPFAFCPWRWRLEHFELDRILAAGQTPTPIRRNAPTVVAPELVPIGAWDAVFIGENTDDGYAVSWGSPDTAWPWRQTFTVTGMGTVEPGWLAYIPLHMVKGEKPKQTPKLPHLEDFAIALREL